MILPSSALPAHRIELARLQSLVTSTQPNLLDIETSYHTLMLLYGISNILCDISDGYRKGAGEW